MHVKTATFCCCEKSEESRETTSYGCSLIDREDGKSGFRSGSDGGGGGVCGGGSGGGEKNEE